MLNEKQFVALALHNMAGIEKGEKLFVDMSNGEIRSKKILSDDRDRNIVFRLTDKQTDYHTVCSAHGFHIVVPDGARLKQALWQIAQDDKQTRVYAIAQVKELYLRNKRKRKSFTVDPEFSDGMREFTIFCNTGDDETGSRAFDIFLKLCAKYK